MPVVERGALWAVAIGLAVFVSRVLVPVPYHLQATAHWPEAAKGLVGALLFSIPYAAMLVVVGRILFPHISGFPGYPLMFVYVFPLACLIIGAFRYFGVGPFRDDRPLEAEAGDEVAPNPPPVQADGPRAPEEAPFFRRLKPALGKALLRMSVQDHYVEATTRHGSQLVLMRFSDALDEVASLPGWRIHRSHWVAEDAIADFRREGGGKLTLITTDGAELPVSRTYQKVLRESGILRRFT